MALRGPDPQLDEDLATKPLSHCQNANNPHLVSSKTVRSFQFLSMQFNELFCNLVIYILKNHGLSLLFDPRSANKEYL